MKTKKKKLKPGDPGYYMTDEASVSAERPKKSTSSSSKSEDSAVESILGPSASPTADYLKSEGGSKPKRYSGKLNTETSIVDFLKSIGEGSSYSERGKRAAEMGIENYRGTAQQNIEMLRRLKGKEVPRETLPEPSAKPAPAAPPATELPSSATETEPMPREDAIGGETKPADNMPGGNAEENVPGRKGKGSVNIGPPAETPANEYWQFGKTRPKPTPKPAPKPAPKPRLREQDILDQNREYVTEADIADGSWESYMSFLDRLQGRKDLSSSDYPNFAEYMALTEEI